MDGLELLVDEEGEQGAAPDLAVDHLPHRGEGRVGDAALLHQVVQDEVQVLERLPEQGEAGLRGLLADELLDVGVDDVVLLEVALEVLVEAGQVDVLLGEDGGAQLHHAQDDVVHQAQLFRPVAQRELAHLPVGQGLVLDAEEPLEAGEPHLELEQLGLAAAPRDVVQPLPELVAQEVAPRLQRPARGVLAAA